MDDQIDNFEGANQRRILHEVVSIRAWFAPIDGDLRRLGLYATVSFLEGRMGGESDASEVRFSISIKRSQIVVIPPADPEISVDPSSVKVPPPLKPLKVREQTARKAQYGWGATLRAKLGSPKEVGVDADFSRRRESERTLVSEQDINPHGEVWLQTQEGHEAWEVNGEHLEKSRLYGTIWNATEGPRLHMIDGRDDQRRARDKKRQLEPVARLEIRCQAKDIDVYDIEFKDPERQARFLLDRNKAEKLLAARQFIKTELNGRLLEPGGIDRDVSAKVRIADVTIKVS